MTRKAIKETEAPMPVSLIERWENDPAQYELVRRGDGPSAVQMAAAQGYILGEKGRVTRMDENDPRIEEARAAMRDMGCILDEHGYILNP